jgi:hypothetical protein
MEERLCKFCQRVFALPDPAFRFVASARHGKEIWTEKNDGKEITHLLESTKRTTFLLRKRAEEQIIKSGGDGI